MGLVEQNIEVMKRAVAAANDGTMATVAPQVIAPGFVRHDPTDALPGVAESGGFIQTLRSAMPDLRVTTEDIFGAGDRVAMRIRVTGTHGRGSRYSSDRQGGGVQRNQYLSPRARKDRGNLAAAGCLGFYDPSWRREGQRCVTARSPLTRPNQRLQRTGRLTSHHGRAVRAAGR